MNCIENGCEIPEEKDYLLLKERNINGKYEISMDKTIHFFGCH